MRQLIDLIKEYGRVAYDAGVHEREDSAEDKLRLMYGMEEHLKTLSERLHSDCP